MSENIPSPKPRAFAKWLDSGETPLAATDAAGALQFANTAFQALLNASSSTSSSQLQDLLQPPPEAWHGKLCIRAIPEDAFNIFLTDSPFSFAHYLPLIDAKSEVFGCLITLHRSTIDTSKSSNLHPASTKLNYPAAESTSDRWLAHVHEFRRTWGDSQQQDILCGVSPQIRRVAQQVQLAIATSSPVMIRGRDLNVCHELAKGIWLQRFRRAQISSAGYQWMPLSARLVEGEKLKSLLEIAKPVRTSSEFIETTLLIEDLSSLSTTSREVLSDWLLEFRPAQLFATTALPSSTSPTALPYPKDALEQHLSVLVIDIPPLAERPEDITYLATRLLNNRASSLKMPPYAFTVEANEYLTAYPWNGDYSELKNLIQSIPLTNEKHMLDIGDLPLPIRSYIGGKSQESATQLQIDLEQLLLQTERSIIERALLESRGNRAQTARNLGMSRPRLLRRLVQLGLETEPTDDGHREARANDKPMKAEPLMDESATIDFTPIDEPKP